MKFELTKHAKKALAEREIPMEWVERTTVEPNRVVSVFFDRKMKGKL